MTLEAGIRACEKDAHCQIKIIAEVLHLVSCSTGRVGGGSSAQALPLRAAMSHAGNHASFQRFARRCWTACRPCEPCLPTAVFEACARGCSPAQRRRRHGHMSSPGSCISRFVYLRCARGRADKARNALDKEVVNLEITAHITGAARRAPYPVIRL